MRDRAPQRRAWCFLRAQGLETIPMFRKSISCRREGTAPLTRYHTRTTGPFRPGTARAADGQALDRPARIPHPDVPPLETISLRPGFEMTLANQDWPDPIRMDFDIDTAPVSFSYAVSLPVCSTLKGNGKNRVVERRPGDCLMGCLPGIYGTTEIPAGFFRGLSLHVSPAVFHDLFPRLPHGLGPLKRRSLGAGQPYVHVSPMNWEARFALGQMLECPYSGYTRQVFLEAKALELIAHKLGQASRPCPEREISLNSRELDRVREAHHILLTRIENPPGLQDLGLLVGMNRNKLNLGFKHLYGGTVFSVLRDARLSLSLSLLRDTRISLAEISLRVGYSDQANFSNAFRRRYGISPKKLRTQGTSSPAFLAV